MYDLDSLTFESYEKYVFPTESFALKSAPSNSAKEAKDLVEGWDFAVVDSWDLIPVLEEKNGWYRTLKGWIPKAKTRVAKSTPIPADVLNVREFGCGDDMDAVYVWRVHDDVGKHHLALCHYKTSNSEYLYVGKKVGDVLVYKYRIPIRFERVDGEGIFEPVQMESWRSFLTIRVSRDFYVTLQMPWGEAGLEVDLSRFNDKVIRFLLNTEVPVQEAPLFINAELLTRKYQDSLP